MFKFPNGERLQQVMDQINQHPETWNQNYWHCDSSHCFMGWAQILSGNPKTHGINTIMYDACAWLSISEVEFYELSASNLSRKSLQKKVAILSSFKYRFLTVITFGLYPLLRSPK